MVADRAGADTEVVVNDADAGFLQMMYPHHTGAVEMAEAELADGSNPDTRPLATDIIAAQQAEIETVNGLLAEA